MQVDVLQSEKVHEAFNSNLNITKYNLFEALETCECNKKLLKLFKCQTSQKDLLPVVCYDQQVFCSPH
jgi:hypothetical protein